MNRLRPSHWHTNDPDTEGVVVLLDGIPLANVIEADEESGSASVFIGDRGDGGPAIAFLSGDVRIVWAP